MMSSLGNNGSNRVALLQRSCPVTLKLSKHWHTDDLTARRGWLRWDLVGDTGVISMWTTRMRTCQVHIPVTQWGAIRAMCCDVRCGPKRNKFDLRELHHWWSNPAEAIEPKKMTHETRGVRMTAVSSNLIVLTDSWVSVTGLRQLCRLCIGSTCWKSECESQHLYANEWLGTK